MNRIPQPIPSIVLAVLLSGLVLMAPIPATADDYLSTGEVIGIGAGSLATLEFGNYIKRRNAETEPRWIGPLGFEDGISRFFGRGAGLGKQNFLDSDFGSAITTLGAGALLAATDLKYPRRDKDKDFVQDQFVFYSGALAVKGVTDLFKGMVSRQRPLGYYAPEIAAQRKNPNPPDDHYSFFSGHASSAFYAMTFVNLRIRATMRNEMSYEDYRDKRWIPSTVCFGWATMVALSRVQAYQHYFTDVAAGALVGYLLGELYYSMADDVAPSAGGSDSPLYIQIRVGF